MTEMIKQEELIAPPDASNTLLTFVYDEFSKGITDSSGVSSEVFPLTTFQCMDSDTIFVEFALNEQDKYDDPVEVMCMLEPGKLKAVLNTIDISLQKDPDVDGVSCQVKNNKIPDNFPDELQEEHLFQFSTIHNYESLSYKHMCIFRGILEVLERSKEFA